MELTSSYAAFMNGGLKATPHVIRRVSTAEGKVLYENTYDNPPRVLDPIVVSEMNTMMEGVIERGTGKHARLDGWPAAGKSGTTQSFRDALFVGFTSQLTTGVWFGNDDGKPMKKVTGGGLPAKAWKEFMTAAHKGLSPSPIFGTTEVQPQFGEPLPGGELPAGELPPGDVMSDAYPAAPGGQGGVLEGPVAAGDPVPAGQEGGGFAPPADVGQTTGATRRTTLLDVLLGN